MTDGGFSTMMKLEKRLDEDLLLLMDWAKESQKFPRWMIHLFALSINYGQIFIMTEKEEKGIAD